MQKLTLISLRVLGGVAAFSGLWSWVVLPRVVEQTSGPIQQGDGVSVIYQRLTIPPDVFALRVIVPLVLGVGLFIFARRIARLLSSGTGA